MKQSLYILAFFTKVINLAVATDCDRQTSRVPNHASLLQRGNGRASEPDPAVYLAGHLKDEFMLDKKGKLRPQDGLSLPWDWATSGPRNAKNDCGDDPGANAAAMDKKIQE